MFYMNDRQYFELNKRLKDLGFVTDTVSITKTIDYESQIPNPTIVTLFTEGKLEDITPEFRKNLRKILTANYEAHVLVPITRKYETQMKNGIEAWVYEYNIMRLNRILEDAYTISSDLLRNAVIIPIVDTDGYGIEAETLGAKKAVKAYQDIGYNASVDYRFDCTPFIRVVLKESSQY